MRKTLITLALSATFTTGVALANQATLDAILDTGIELSPEQISLFQSTEGQSEAILGAIGNVLPSACSTEQSITDFVKAVVTANPDLSDDIFQLASTTCPDMIASIAEAILETEAPAAGIEADGDGATPGTQTLAGTGPGTSLGAPRAPSAGGAALISSPN